MVKVVNYLDTKVVLLNTSKLYVPFPGMWVIGLDNQYTKEEPTNETYDVPHMA